MTSFLICALALLTIVAMVHCAYSAWRRQHHCLSEFSRMRKWASWEH